MCTALQTQMNRVDRHVDRMSNVPRMSGLGHHDTVAKVELTPQTSSNRDMLRRFVGCESGTMSDPVEYAVNPEDRGDLGNLS